MTRINSSTCSPAATLLKAGGALVVGFALARPARRAARRAGAAALANPRPRRGRRLPRDPRRRHGHRLLRQGRSRHRPPHRDARRWRPRSSAWPSTAIDAGRGRYRADARPGRDRRQQRRDARRHADPPGGGDRARRRCSRLRRRRLEPAGGRARDRRREVRPKGGGAGVGFGGAGRRPPLRAQGRPQGAAARPRRLHAGRQAAAAARRPGQVAGTPRVRARLQACRACCTRG